MKSRKLGIVTQQEYQTEYTADKKWKEFEQKIMTGDYKNRGVELANLRRGIIRAIVIRKFRHLGPFNMTFIKTQSLWEIYVSIRGKDAK